MVLVAASRRAAGGPVVGVECPKQFHLGQGSTTVSWSHALQRASLSRSSHCRGVSSTETMPVFHDNTQGSRRPGWS